MTSQVVLRRISGESRFLMHKLALHYSPQRFYGIEVADEGLSLVLKMAFTAVFPGHSLRSYYRRAYETIRSAAGESLWSFFQRWWLASRVWKRL